MSGWNDGIPRLLEQQHPSYKSSLNKSTNRRNKVGEGWVRKSQSDIYSSLFPRCRISGLFIYFSWNISPNWLTSEPSWNLPDTLTSQLLLGNARLTSKVFSIRTSLQPFAESCLEAGNHNNDWQMACGRKRRAEQITSINSSFAEAIEVRFFTILLNHQYPSDFF